MSQGVDHQQRNKHNTEGTRTPKKSEDQQQQELILPEMARQDFPDTVAFEQGILGQLGGWGECAAV